MRVIFPVRYPCGHRFVDIPVTYFNNEKNPYFGSRHQHVFVSFSFLLRLLLLLPIMPNLASDEFSSGHRRGLIFIVRSASIFVCFVCFCWYVYTALLFVISFRISVPFCFLRYIYFGERVVSVTKELIHIYRDDDDGDRTWRRTFGSRRNKK